MSKTMATRLLSLSSRRLSALLPRHRLLSSAIPILPPLHPPSSPFQCRVNHAGISTYPPLNSEGKSNNIEKPPADDVPLFPGCDYKHWLIIMDKPGGENASKEQIINCYIETLAKVVGSEEEAKKKIYSVSFDKYVGFGCELDEETSNKLEGMPGIMFVLPDSYVDPEHKDYGGELFVNGEIVQRPPERQKRVMRQPEGRQDRPRNNDRTTRMASGQTKKQ